MELAASGAPWVGGGRSLSGQHCQGSGCSLEMIWLIGSKQELFEIFFLHEIIPLHHQSQGLRDSTFRALNGSRATWCVHHDLMVRAQSRATVSKANPAAEAERPEAASKRFPLTSQYINNSPERRRPRLQPPCDYLKGHTSVPDFSRTSSCGQLRGLRTMSLRRRAFFPSRFPLMGTVIAW